MEPRATSRLAISSLCLLSAPSTWPQPGTCLHLLHTLFKSSCPSSTLFQDKGGDNNERKKDKKEDLSKPWSVKWSACNVEAGCSWMERRRAALATCIVNPALTCAAAVGRLRHHGAAAQHRAALCLPCPWLQRGLAEVTVVLVLPQDDSPSCQET